MKLKVINIVNHPPAYEAHRGRPRPKINWDLPDGSWIGIWGYEWHDIIGNKVLEISNDIEYEVWQPDLRADKIYEHTFESGLLHKSFPAVAKKFLHGIKHRDDIYSEFLMLELEKEYKSGRPLVLHINAGFRFINIPILKKYSKKIPIVGQFYTNSIDIFDLPKTNKPIKLFHAYLKFWELTKYYKLIKYIIPSVVEGTEYFENKFGTKVFNRDFANFGSSVDDWKRKYSKEEVKTKLNIPLDKFVFFSSSRLIPVKQIDKMLIALSKLENQNYICYISGRGSEEYEIYLNNMIKELKLEDRIVFIKYVDYKVLQEYFQAADILLSTSKMDAGPSAPFEASAMDTPSILTDTGIASEFFKLTNTGIIIPTDDYEKWIIELNAAMKGKEIKIPLREDLIAFGDWNKISKYYYNIYKTIQNKQ